MPEILTGCFAPRRWGLFAPGTLRVVNWNIERGLRLSGIVDFLAEQDADLITLQEADLNSRRTKCMNIAQEIARALRLNYAFGHEFQELAEGSDASPAYSGQATLSRWPIENARVIRFRRQSGFWHPRWYVPNVRVFQERLGGRIALVTHVRAAGMVLATYNLHLESRGDDALRASQLAEVMADASHIDSGVPVLVAGDLNFDPLRGPAAALLESAGFVDAVGQQDVPTTPRRHLFHPGISKDRAMVRGNVRLRGGNVHSTVRVSDHYPITFRLEIS
jgi:endonuclease/exonuclease/phosphatase family metal-dependent hydrolase